MKLNSDLAKHKEEINKLSEDIKRKARKQEQAEKMEKKRRAEREREQRARQIRGMIHLENNPIENPDQSPDTLTVKKLKEKIQET